MQTDLTLCRREKISEVALMCAGIITFVLPFACCTGVQCSPWTQDARGKAAHLGVFMLYITYLCWRYITLIWWDIQKNISSIVPEWSSLVSQGLTVFAFSVKFSQCLSYSVRRVAGEDFSSPVDCVSTVVLCLLCRKFEIQCNLFCHLLSYRMLLESVQEGFAGTHDLKKCFLCVFFQWLQSFW